MDPGAGAHYSARTAEEVFRDFRGRRAGMIKALTNDVEKFYQLCDPEKENLCLYGYPNETWEVTLPAEEVPPEIPEPALGINFARDGMNEKDWLALVAVHSDSWLLAVAFYFAARFGFDKEARIPEEEELMTINIDSSEQSRARLQLQPIPRRASSASPDLEAAGSASSDPWVHAPPRPTPGPRAHLSWSPKRLRHLPGCGLRSSGIPHEGYADPVISRMLV
ncbi:PHD finger protein ALFIN-LIKE 5 isoform X2 [Miscanthus floridulus]|uniref:PHD finger protein ALFIN-LIKE 5 isoform X2 n=1 Tax=Miscanthus floridulus TaxID=154761 RepID=UPI0034583D88